jgi:predicted nucleic acid-binding protein
VWQIGPEVTRLDAVMQGRDIGRILSFDARFDGIPGIVRLA